jgi:two-component system, chemotaxis family, response regulator PixG
LDVGMPRVDGYELCRLLRKHPLFKKIPIIMVTGNTGLIDRARAKMSGTTDYMTKPFTQADLLKMVFRHLE